MQLTKSAADGLYWLGAESQVITWTIASTGVTSGLVRSSPSSMELIGIKHI